MNFSPAMMHKKRVKEKLEKEALEKEAQEALENRDSSDSSKQLDPVGNSYALALESLKRHNDILKGKSKSEKIDLKKALLPQYFEFLEAYRDGEVVYDNIVLVTMMIWLFDVDAIHEAVELAVFAIDQEQPMPDGFKTQLPSFAAEAVCDWSQKQYESDASAFPYFEDMLQRVMTGEWEVTHPIVFNKIYKMAAYFAEKDNEFDTALEWYDKCVEVNPDKHGVKTRRAALLKKIKKSEEKDD